MGGVMLHSPILHLLKEVMPNLNIQCLLAK